MDYKSSGVAVALDWPFEDLSPSPAQFSPTLPNDLASLWFSSVLPGKWPLGHGRFNDSRDQKCFLQILMCYLNLRKYYTQSRWRTQNFQPLGQSKFSNSQRLSSKHFYEDLFSLSLPSPTIQYTGKAKVKAGLKIFLLLFEHTKFGGKELTYCSYIPLSRNISTTEISFIFKISRLAFFPPSKLYLF